MKKRKKKTAIIVATRSMSSSFEKKVGEHASPAPSCDTRVLLGTGHAFDKSEPRLPCSSFGETERRKNPKGLARLAASPSAELSAGDETAWNHTFGTKK